MYKIEKIIKTTALLAGLFGFVGCGGTCCSSDVSVSKGGTPSVIPNETLSIIPKEVPSVTSKEVPSITPKEVPSITPTGETDEIIEIIPLQPDAVANDIDEFIEVKPCAVVNFSDVGSYDPDANLTYKWTGLGDKIMSEESSFDHRFNHKGLYEATLTVTDEQNSTAFDRVCVLVGIDEIPLLADAGVNQEISSAQNVTLSGRAVCRDDIASYEWKEGTKIISEESTFVGKLPIGKHRLKLYIEDFAGNKACDRVVVTVK